MKWTSAPLGAAYVLEPEPIADERGFFARTWCAEEFASRGLNAKVSQCSVSFNTRKGTLRGMHYQAEPYAEAKLVRCIAGAIFDVIVDLRRASPTYCQWFAIELSSANRKSLYVPEGFAHGFMTLQDNSEVAYQISQSYRPECARGIRWNDPLFAIKWPIRDPIVSARDRAFADFTR